MMHHSTPFFKVSLKIESISEYSDATYHPDAFLELSLKMWSTTEYVDVIYIQYFWCVFGAEFDYVIYHRIHWCYTSFWCILELSFIIWSIKEYSDAICHSDAFLELSLYLTNPYITRMTEVSHLHSYIPKLDMYLPYLDCDLLITLFIDYLYHI